MSRTITAGPAMTLETFDQAAAQRAVAATLDHAAAHGWRISVAVLDGGGHLLAFGRVAGAALHTIDVAQDKAFTAVSFGMPTDELGLRLRDAPEHVRWGLLLRPRLVSMGGAIPIRTGELLQGAIGVSGASEEQDCECAVAGLRAIGAA
jgi:uncharacterized protein GlcG (DUF336 family)